MYHCPRCGLAESSHDGETFCGTCEDEFQKEMAQQRFYDQHPDPYLQAWGQYIFIRREAGYDALEECLFCLCKRVKNNDFPSDPELQEYLLEGEIKARMELREQLQKGEFDPPEDAKHYVPFV